MEKAIFSIIQWIISQEDLKNPFFMFCLIIAHTFILKFLFFNDNDKKNKK